MPKAPRVLVAIVVLELGVLLGAVVPRELQQALLARREPVRRHALGAGVAQEVQAEAGRRGLVGPEQRHAQHLLVELERLLGVLDADHRVVLREGEGNVSGFFYVPWG